MIEIASDPERSLYPRLVSIRAVVSIGTTAQIQELWATFNSSPAPLSRRLLAEFVQHASVTAETVALLLVSLEQLEPRKKFEASGLTHSINQFVARAVVDEDALDGGALGSLASGLKKFLDRPPYVRRLECQVSKTFKWLMSPALHTIERLIIARSSHALSDDAFAILAAVPALRFWRGDDYQERKSTVETLVPEWIELNDALFWWTVADCRAIKSATGEALIDDWPVTYIGHFWKFDAASFPRTLLWVTSRALPDDRLVALALCFTTFARNDRPPEWLEQMRTAVAGDPVLEAALKAKLNPPETDAVRQHKAWERKHQRDRSKQERREKRDRAVFVADMKADPVRVRTPPGIKRGQFAKIHYNLLRIVEGDGMRESRAQGAQWAALIPEFGQTVAEAYRDAAKAFWRDYKPGLRSEGASTTQTPYALIFAMAGLDIELSQADAIPALTLAHTRRAFRYAIWELNGFPRWFEALYRARPKQGFQFMWTEILWELANTPIGESLHYVLSDLVYYAPWLHGEFAQPLFEWLTTSHAPGVETLRNMRTIIVSGKGANEYQTAVLARAKLADTRTPDNQRPIWYAIWVDSEPAMAISSLDELLGSGTLSDPLEFTISFVNALLGGRDDTSPVSGFGCFQTPTYLKQLYLLMHREIRVVDDLQRAGKGVYSPTPRDSAQDARERLYQLLTQIPGHISYEAIRELAHEHPNGRYRDAMAAQAYARAVADGDIAVWKQDQVAAMARRLAAIPAGAGARLAAD
jgi:hypothetical protein